MVGPWAIQTRALEEMRMNHIQRSLARVSRRMAVVSEQATDDARREVLLLRSEIEALKRQVAASATHA